MSEKQSPPRTGPEIALIVRLSRKLHGSKASADDFTFRSLAEHVEEVRELIKAGDVHWKAETMDIIIHALVLLKRHGATDKELAELFRKRTGRFREKIMDALNKQR